MSVPMTPAGPILQTDGPRRPRAVALCLGLIAAVAFSVQGVGHGALAHDAAGTVSRPTPAAFAVPDTEVRDQNGRRLRFYSDLVKGRVVAINFIFTGCSSICPGLTTTFRGLQDLLGTQDVQLISVSVDPANDGPAELKAYAASFDVQPGWSFVTGRPDQIARLVKALGGGAGSAADHPSLVVVYDDAGKRATQVPGTASAAELLKAIKDARTPEPGTPPLREGADAARYFTNLPLQTQDGQTVRFFDDLVRGRIVVIDFIYTNCPDICSPATGNLSVVQDRLGPRLGRTVNFLSISVDPEHDTPAVLKRYAADHGARDGWSFLTAAPGKRANVDWVAYRLGGYAENPAEHGTTLAIGNAVTGEWVKLPALSAPDTILAVIDRLAGPDDARLH